MNIRKLNLAILTATVLIVVGYSPRVNAIEISQMPVSVNPDIHPGNLVLVPSVEWPTVMSVANLGDYDPDQAYAGYFDADKCYVYNHFWQEENRHFAPVRFASEHRCGGDDEWSGNFMNWAATQTIDPFRKVLTGGLRSRDTPTETWLEKARHTGQGGTGLYPNRSLYDNEVIRDATPFNANSLHLRVQGLGNRMRFQINESGELNGDHENFNPSQHPDPEDPDDEAYDVAVRVAVCTSESLRESNCRQFSQGWKPMGLIQTNSSNLRYSIFGYLNDSDDYRDGAALRARQKFVGPVIPGEGPNPNTEWHPETGVFNRNPNPEDADDTSSDFGLDIDDSGVINYLNKFGQLNNNNLKSNDPVSELFYAAVRYIRGEDNVAPYTNNATAAHADGFPVITDWDKDGHDPVLSACQVNVALGIGDIYTHDDKNLPGNTSSAGQEPSKPAAVANDTWIDVVSATNRVGSMQGVGNIGNGGNFTGRSNSAYIAGLAYWANTMDMRPDEDGKVTMSTHWVDVLEAQSLEGMSRNQYALAAKFGGLKIPDDVEFDPMNDGIEEAWWHTNGETMTPFGSRGNGQASFKRPDNFYTAGNASQMVESLAEAFENILEEIGDVVSGVATTSQRLTTDTLVLQAGFSSDFWTGEIIALDPEDGDQEWRASDNFRSDGVRGSTFTSDPTANSNPGRRFDDSLSGAPLERLATTLLPDDMSVPELIRFVLGDRSKEDGDKVRFRGEHTLGDIVNSRPVSSGPGNEGWGRLPEPYGESYSTYLDGNKADRGRWVFAGANDGMLHAFNAENGVRAFSFLPYGVLQNLGLLAGADYNDSHRFFVDGGLTVRDAYVDGGWKTILVGSLGAGGKSVFALDVTDPDSFSESDVLWEYNAEVADDDDLGYTFGTPEITRLEDDTWVALFGNGYDSVNGDAVLYVVDLESGEVIDDGRVRFSDDTEDNGLSSPAVLLDSQTQTHLARVYAGDLDGNIWRADSDESGMASVGFNPLFTASSGGNGGGGNGNGNGNDNDAEDDSRRSITTKPTLAVSGRGGVSIFFGTGRLLSDTDRASDDVESFYSIRDDDEAVDSGDLSSLTLSVNAEGVREIEDAGAGDKGWKLDLAVSGSENGERVLTNASITYGRLIFTTYEPAGDVCSAEIGINRPYVMDAIGGALIRPPAPEGIDGPPLELPPIFEPPIPPEPPEDGEDPPPPGDGGYEPPQFPEVEGPDEFCSSYGYPDPSTGQYVRLGSICDGRQIWRQAR